MGKTKKRGGAARDEEPASTESEESEDGMCDYEKLRLQNIRKNHSVLRSLGKLTTTVVIYTHVHV